jgi:hypothetical protein
MSLGYTGEGGGFVKGSSVVLRDNMRVSDSEAVRKSCYEVRRWGRWGAARCARGAGLAAGGLAG